MKPTHILLALVLLILVAGTATYPHKNRNDAILNATESISSEDYALLRAKVMSEYKYSNLDFWIWRPLWG
ncbi:hypothetical protein DRN34_04760 [Thermococci archaeon]|nr:MAG: hypothetical protein DRN34_04760 [Thermococci archaeon]